MWQNAILDIGSKLIERLIPDPQAKAEAQLKLIEMQQKGELDMVNAQLSAIVAEANSTDKWTSRARPSFLYVIYFMILWSVPMGVLAAFQPGFADAIITGQTKYLNAIPEELYGLFGVGYLGYTAARQWGKARGSDR